MGRFHETSFTSPPTTMSGFFAPARAPKFPYPGAKGRLAPELVRMMPHQGRVFLDLFAGRGNVLFAATMVLQYRRWWLNDISTANFFQCLRDTGGNIIVPHRTEEGKTPEYEKYKALYECGDPTAILIEPNITWSGGGYKYGGPGGKRSANADGYARTLKHAARIMIERNVQISALDWTKVGLNKLGPKDFVFFDPPYYGADVRPYSSNGFDYEGMIYELKHAKYHWMLTEYKQDFYMKAFGKPCFTRKVQCAVDGNGKTSRVECVWTNYK